jgi:Protein of unknown function (DUF3054)
MLSRLGPGIAAASDAAAIVVFVTIGLASHDRGLTATGYARDALPFLGCWFAAALGFRLYRQPTWARLAATWAVGVPAAVLIRALVLGRHLNGKEAAFLVVSLVTLGVLVTAFRLTFMLLLPRGRPARS